MAPKTKAREQVLRWVQTKLEDRLQVVERALGWESGDLSSMPSPPSTHYVTFYKYLTSLDRSFLVFKIGDRKSLNWIISFK